MHSMRPGMLKTVQKLDAVRIILTSFQMDVPFNILAQLVPKLWVLLIVFLDRVNPHLLFPKTAYLLQYSDFIISCLIIMWSAFLHLQGYV